MMSKNVLRTLLGVATAVSAGMVAGVAFGEELPSTGAIEEIVVTAMRRESTLQDTAASIQALSGTRLDQLNIGATGDLQAHVPGLLVTTNTAMQDQLYIRGVGNNLTGLGASNSVATYVDGVYISNAIAVAQSFNDIDRIEVLKGPQATLYGRNATGGAVNIITKQPTFDPSFSADAMVGNYDTYDVRASVNGPIAGDTVAGRLSVMAQGHQGYATNVYLGDHPGGDQELGAKGALQFVVTPDIDVLVRADYRHFITGDYVKGLDPNGYIYLTSTTPNQYISDPWKIRGDVTSRQPGEDTGGSVRFNWNTSLGQLTSTTSYRWFSSGPGFADLDSIVGTFAGTSRSDMAGEKYGQNQLFHETLFTTSFDSPFQAVFGVNYFNEAAVDEARRISTATAVGSARRHSWTESAAAFVDLSYNITDTLKLVGGVRYTKEWKDYSQLVTVTIQGVAPGFASNSRSWDSTSPRVGLEWRPEKGQLYYITATSGFKSGGFNETDPHNVFNPEKIWSYEAGAKTSWFDDRITANASAYYYDYKDLQISLVVPITLARLVANAPSSKLYGVDIDLAGSVTDNLTVGASLALEHSEYGDLILCDNVAGPCSTSPNDQGFVNVQGNPLAYAPSVTFSPYFDYGFEIAEFPGRFSFHGDAYYRSRTYVTPFDRAAWQSADPVWLLNAQVRYDAPSGWFVSAFGQNLTDETFVTFGSASGVLRSPASSQVAVGESLLYARLAPPRTYGLRVGVSL